MRTELAAPLGSDGCWSNRCSSKNLLNMCAASVRIVLLRRRGIGRMRDAKQLGFTKLTMGSNSLPAETKVVIVGGGVIGTSVAYHLTQLGWRDVVLLEQNQLAAGTSWHAAGLIGRLRTSNSMTRINKYTVELYSQLEAETGHSVGWKQ